MFLIACLQIHVNSFSYSYILIFFSYSIPSLAEFCYKKSILFNECYSNLYLGTDKNKSFTGFLCYCDGCGGCCMSVLNNNITYFFLWSVVIINKCIYCVVMYYFLNQVQYIEK